MLHLIPDGSDGFFVFDDVVADLEGGIALVLVGSFCISLPISLIIAGPERFTMALFSLMCSIFLQLYCSRRGSLFFLTPLSLIFTSYSLLSGAWAMMSSAGGEWGLLMLPILAMILIALGAALYLPLLGEYMGVMWTLIFGTIAWATSLYSVDTMNEYRHSPAAYYTMRIVTIIVLIYVAICFAQWCIQLIKGKFDTKDFIASLKGFGFGFIPLIAIFVLGSILPKYNDFVNIVFAFAILVGYGVLAIWSSKIIGNEYHLHLLGPTLLTIILHYGSKAQLNAPSEFMEGFVNLIHNMPFLNVVQSTSYTLAVSFQSVFTKILNLIVSLILRIFDHGSVHFEVPFELSLLVAVFLILGVLTKCSEKNNSFIQKIMAKFNF